MTKHEAQYHLVAMGWESLPFDGLEVEEVRVRPNCYGDDPILEFHGRRERRPWKAAFWRRRRIEYGSYGEPELGLSILAVVGGGRPAALPSVVDAIDEIAERCGVSSAELIESFVSGTPLGSPERGPR